VHPERISDKQEELQLPDAIRQTGAYFTMLIYRFLSGEDDSAFCHKVTKALSEGWELHGSPSYAYDAMSKKMRCGQAITKVVRDQPYDPERKLADYE
jgi:hypothetical protein